MHIRLNSFSLSVKSDGSDAWAMGMLFIFTSSNDVCKLNEGSFA